MRLAIAGFSAGLFLAATMSGALAQRAPALVTGDVNHRAGPTTNSPSYGAIRGGTTVYAGPCGGGWCAADFAGNRGYISQSFLDFGGPPPGGYYVAPVAPPPPPVIYAPPPPVYYPAPRYPHYHRSWDSRRW